MHLSLRSGTFRFLCLLLPALLFLLSTGCRKYRMEKLYANNVISGHSEATIAPTDSATFDYVLTGDEDFDEARCFATVDNPAPDSVAVSVRTLNDDRHFRVTVRPRAHAGLTCRFRVYFRTDRGGLAEFAHSVSLASYTQLLLQYQPYTLRDSAMDAPFDSSHVRIHGDYTVQVVHLPGDPANIVQFSEFGIIPSIYYGGTSRSIEHVRVQIDESTGAMTPIDAAQGNFISDYTGSGQLRIEGAETYARVHGHVRYRFSNNQGNTYEGRFGF